VVWVTGGGWSRAGRDGNVTRCPARRSTQGSTVR